MIQAMIRIIIMIDGGGWAEERRVKAALCPDETPVFRSDYHAIMMANE